MSGPVQRLVRWLRLVLAFLMVAGAGATAHALPPAQAAVTAVLVESRGPTEHRTAIERAVHVGQVEEGDARLLSWSVSTGHGLEPPPAGSPHRLFLLHRALLL
jgi:hypothetical protein